MQAALGRAIPGACTGDIGSCHTSNAELTRVNHFDRFSVAAFFVALFLRLAFVQLDGASQPPTPGTDSAEYDAYAWNLANGQGYRGPSPDVSDKNHLTAYRPPGLSLVWAGIYRVVGHSYAAVRVFDCLLSAATIFPIISIGQRCFDRLTGRLAAGVWMVWPMSLYLTTQLLSESLTTLLFTGYLALSLRFAEQPTVARSLVSGTALGLTCLTHASKVFMFPLAGVWALWQFRRNWRNMLLAAAIPCFGAAVIAPWCIRNYVVMHSFIPLSTAGGSALLQGNNRVVLTEPRYFGYSVWDTEIPEYRDALRAPNDEVERDRVAGRFAVEWLKGNYRHLPYLVQAKLRRAFTPFLQPHTPLLYRAATLAAWGPVLILSAVAFVPTGVRFLRADHPGWLLHLAVIHFVVLSAVFFGNARYRHPIEPICILLAAAGAVGLFRFFPRRPCAESPA